MGRVFNGSGKPIDGGCATLHMLGILHQSWHFMLSSGHATPSTWQIYISECLGVLIIEVLRPQNEPVIIEVPDVMLQSSSV